MKLFSESVNHILDDEYDIELSKELKSQYEINLEQGDKQFENLSNIYENRERYKLDWAFKEASEIYQKHAELSKDKMSVKFPVYNDNFRNVRQDVAEHIESSTKMYSLFSTLVSILDIVVSVILILIVTLAATVFEKAIESIIFTIIFVLIVALFKVVLDRFIVIPRIEKWGWKQFYFISEELISITAHTVAMRIAILSKYSETNDIDQVTNLCRNGFDHIKQNFLSIRWIKVI